MGNSMIMVQDPTNLKEIARVISSKVGLEIKPNNVETGVSTRGTHIYFVSKSRVKGLKANVFCTVRNKEKYCTIEYKE